MTKPSIQLPRRALLMAAVGGGAAATLSALPASASTAPMAAATSTRQAAAAAQRGLQLRYGAPWPQLLHNTTPSTPGSDDQFHYWWLAHAIDTAVDAYDRTGRRADLTRAERILASVRQRNGGSLVNDYFDDMNWMALAVHRLWQRTGKRSYLDDAVALWEEIREHGWNDTFGPSVAWRREQLDYKNTPSNAPFAILGYRLAHELDDPRYLEHADIVVDWMRRTLVDAETGLVADGINRQGDGQVDWGWRFTYCQGVWVGALVEAYRHHGDPSLLAEASATALFSIRELTAGLVFRSEGQGDGGLFKGIWYRYVPDLVAELDAGPARREIAGFVLASTRMLAEVGSVDGIVLAGPDWAAPATEPNDLSTQLSGVMALEARHRLA